MFLLFGKCLKVIKIFGHGCIFTVKNKLYSFEKLIFTICVNKLNMFVNINNIKPANAN